MVLECWVILIMLGVAGYMFIRSRKKKWALGVLPLMLLPLVNIIYSPIGMHIYHESHNFFKAGLIRLILYLVSFVVASVGAVLFARTLPTGRSKYAYVISSILFTGILIIIFIVKLAKL